MISFIITTFQRDTLLYKSLESLLKYIQPNWNIIVVDQGNLTSEKEAWLDKNKFDSLNYSRHNDEQKLFYYQVPFNSGLSYGRNFGVQKAKELGSEFCVIGSDSFLFNNTIERLKYIERIFDEHGCDKIGFELTGCKCRWEAELNLIEGETFELNFCENIFPIYRTFHEYVIGLKRVEICRNFFMATTESLLNTQWDNKLKLGEHEDQAYIYKQKGYWTFWTDFITAEKMTARPDEYSKYRKENFSNGLVYLREKYKIKGWVSYKNLDRAKYA